MLRSHSVVMLSQETQVPDYLMYHVPAPESPAHEYVGMLVENMEQAHDALWEKQ